MKYMLVGTCGKVKSKRTFSITTSNQAKFNDNPDPMKSFGVIQLKESIKKAHPGKRFAFSLYSLQ